MKNLILSLDQGTTGSTALVMNTKGKVLGSSNVPFKQIFPKAGWVEHDPDEILKSMKKAIRLVFKKIDKDPKDILTIGITNQRETVVFWDGKTGKTFGNAIVWQCRRTTKRAEEIKKNGDASWIKKKTGLSVDPYFSSTKIEWFLKKNKSSHKNLRVGTIDTFLLWNLTGGESFYTEPSNASRMQLFNIKTQKWDEKLLDYFGVPKSVLPEVVDSNSNFGSVKGFKPLVDGTPITGILGDQQAALFGQGALKAGDLKCTFGTGSFILLNTGGELTYSKAGLLSTVAWRLKGKGPVYALEGGAFNCGSCINWFVSEFSSLKKSSDIGPLAQSVPSSLGVKFAPTFSGLGAPYWNSESRGAFVGLSRGVKGAHMARAVLEGLSFQNTLIFEAMEKDFGKLKNIFVDGGVSRSDFLMDRQAVFSGKKLVRPQNIETTAVGAALMAGVGAGVFKAGSKQLNPVEKVFRKNIGAVDKKLVRSYRGLFESLSLRPFIEE
ncbi:MAG: FGGY-family carbohydrate kinase [Bdellovibrionales bacterium]